MRDRLFTMLWIGGDLNPLAVVSMRSFLAHGHRVQLFTYGDVTNIPAGVISREASDIIPAEEMELWRHDPAKFSDFFRLCFLWREGGFWVDADFICISKEVPYEDFYWAKTDQGRIFNAAIAFPKGHEVMRLLSFYAYDPRLCPPVDYAYFDLRMQLAQEGLTREEAIQKAPLWTNGSEFLETVIQFFGYERLSKPYPEVYPIPWGIWTALYDDDMLTLDHKAFMNTWAIHCWNDMAGEMPLLELLNKEGLIPHLMRHYLEHTTPYETNERSTAQRKT